MERFPFLNFILRFGKPASALIALLAAAGLLCLALPAWGWPAAVAALAVGGVTYVLARAFVELVVLVTEMLVPR